MLQQCGSAENPSCFLPSCVREHLEVYFLMKLFELWILDKIEQKAGFDMNYSPFIRNNR